MKKNITEIKRNLIERLFTVLHRDYNECTIYTPGIEAIIPGANGITIKRLENYDYKTNKTSLRYKLHVVTINDANHYDWETTIAKFDSLDPDTREKLERFISAKCDNASADMPTTFVGHAYYFTLEGEEKENNIKLQSNMKAHMYKEVTNDNGYKSYYHASDNNATYILTSAYAHDMYSEFVDKYSRIPSSRWYRKNFNFERVHE